MGTENTSTQPHANEELSRRDLLLLRHTFDFHLGRSSEVFLQARGKKRIREHDLPRSTIKDLLIVSLKIVEESGELAKENGHYQIGISILDTRNLQTRISDTYPQEKSGFVIQTHPFCTGSDKYSKSTSKKYSLGHSRHITIEQVRLEIQKIISHGKRDVILVSHGDQQGHAFLNAAQIHIRPLYVVDTQKVARILLDLDDRCSLEQILTLLECPFDAGMLQSVFDESNLTLRALLLLAVVDARNALVVDPACEALLVVLETIARGNMQLEMSLASIDMRAGMETKDAPARKRRTKVGLTREKAKRGNAKIARVEQERSSTSLRVLDTPAAGLSEEGSWEGVRLITSTCSCGSPSCKECHQQPLSVDDSANTKE